jgi:hypothetical protein
MAELTGKAPHKGQVVVTRKTGVSTTFVDLDKAEAACGDLQGSLTYFRGAFFESGASRRADAAASTKAAPPAPPAPPKTTKKSSRRRRESAPEAGAGDD